MQTVEVTNARDAKRAKLAQYTGADRTLVLGQVPVTGVVVSVREVSAGRWSVTVKPSPSRQTIKDRLR